MEDDVFRMRMMMIRWTLPRLEDFINLINVRRAFLNFFSPRLPRGPRIRREIRKPDDCNTHNLRYWDQIQQLRVFNTAQAAARHSGQYEMPYERN
jgi:hypothetical protein